VTLAANYVEVVDSRIQSKESGFYQYTGWTKKREHFYECITPVYNDVGRHSIYQNVQLFVSSKTGILNVAIFIYSLHKITAMILH